MLTFDLPSGILGMNCLVSIGKNMIVMISGSRSIRRLNNQVTTTLNKIMQLDFEIVIGDCYGIDTLVQHYLKSCNYQKVTVYHIGTCPRNNYGFKTHKIQGNYYSNKDIAMCKIANYGLAIWDGKSKGTQNNITRIEKTKIIMS